MPNWCENEVEISGKKEDIKKVVELITEKIDFNRIIPMPENIDNEADWQEKEWGCKGGVNPDNVMYFEQKESSLQLGFLTPWSPPEGIYNKLKELFPDIEIEWFYKEPLGRISGWLE